MVKKSAAEITKQLETCLTLANEIVQTFYLLQKKWTNEAGHTNY